MIFPIGIQDFTKIRDNGFVYVDKTDLIYKLANTGSFYFLSRPRRFGKSLLISTLEAYLSGRRELFEGLAIEGLEKEWAAYPVLRLDLNTGRYEKPEDLDIVLDDALRQWERAYGRPDEPGLPPALRFKAVIEKAAEKTGRRVAVLVDEYDKPMLQALGDEKLTAAFRSALKAFYSVLKTQDRYIRLGFLTGVTKFSKVSIFSDLNNLDDISMDRRYASLCGITESELRRTFAEPVAELAAACGMSEGQCYDKLRLMYDGYHFQAGTEGVYNPFSLLSTLAKSEFGNYWFETGTPTFLAQVIKSTDYDLSRLQSEDVTSELLGSIENISRSPIPVLYQSGYLTIKSYNDEFDSYRLGFPNKEVERGFWKYLLPTFAHENDDMGQSYVRNFVREVESGEADEFLKRLQTMLAGSDYRIAGRMEVYFQNVLFTIFRMMGFFTQVEQATSNGRVDVTIETADFVYMIEIKLDGDADEALRQIVEKGYARPFAGNKRRVFKIGVNFSSATRTIEQWRIE
ncbi:MAG: AAA family ATPase [Marinilabiliaceae bacterium]